ncbi:MAG: isochorismatase family protein [Armatimonadota bacterium]|nr:isochorismatase family protein [Armatimonadota bacterium]
MRSWEHVIPKMDLAVHDAAGYGRPMGLGVRPAALVIDLNYRFLGWRPEPILQAVELWPKSSGERGWQVLPSVRRFLTLCRQARVPIIFTTGQAGAPRSLQAEKSRQRGPDADEGELAIVEEVNPAPGEMVMPKPRASAFFGTPLLSHLIRQSIDTLLLCGCTTSGCVRATAVDATSYGFRVAVVEECVFDRFEISHHVALFDLNAKYADVISLADLEAYLTGLWASSMEVTC